MTPSPAPATVFLDRDGVLNRKAPEGEYITTVGAFVWEPGAIEALRKLADAGSRLVVITNQRGVARGRMTMEDLESIHEQVRTDLSEAGVAPPAIYSCPHDVGSCDCRKPGIGMLEMAVRDAPSIDPADSAMVGDSLSDLEAGASFGVGSNHLVASGDRRKALEAQAAERGIRIDSVHDSLADLIADRWGLS